MTLQKTSQERAGEKDKRVCWAWRKKVASWFCSKVKKKATSSDFYSYLHFNPIVNVILKIERASQMVRIETLTEKMQKHGGFLGQLYHYRDRPDYSQNWCESYWWFLYGHSHGWWQPSGRWRFPGRTSNSEMD